VLLRAGLLACGHGTARRLTGRFVAKDTTARSDGWGKARVDRGVQRSLGVAEFSGSSGGVDDSEAAAFGPGHTRKLDELKTYQRGLLVLARADLLELSVCTPSERRAAGACSGRINDRGSGEQTARHRRPQ
jgi:hypothetical protein